MKKTVLLFFCLCLGNVFMGLAQMKELSDERKEAWSHQDSSIVETTVGTLKLPPPFHSESVSKQSEIVPWPKGTAPKAPEGFTVEKFADGFENPRWTYVAPNNDIFVVESDTRNSADRITVLRDGDGDFLPDTRQIFLDELNKPFGMLILEDYFYVANTSGLYRYPYTEGDLKIEGEGEKIVDLPAGGYNNHWTRNLLANEDGSKIYITVGSASNAGEYGMDKEEGRAAIWEINPDGTGKKIYASGLRNPVGIDWNPITGDLWAAVNERDKLGNNLVPDYITSVREGGWYGWPYSYYGSVPDPRWEDDPHQEMVEKAIVPDVPVGPHTASLGLAFYTGNQFPEHYQNGAFVGQHGSWNRTPFSGYKVIFVPFEDGIPQQPEDFLTGFIAAGEKNEVYGRPVAVTPLPDGSLLVNDDAGNVIWRISYE